MAELSREHVRQELLAAVDSYRALLAAATLPQLRRRTNGTRWTNRQMLFHLLLGYLVVRVLMPLVSLVNRLPPWVWRGFVTALNASARPFHFVNYLGSALAGNTLSLPTMARLFDRTCAVLADRLDRATDAELARRIPFPPRWDPFFTDHMSLLDIYHYPWQHDEFHRRQLTLGR